MHTHTGSPHTRKYTHTHECKRICNHRQYTNTHLHACMCIVHMYTHTNTCTLARLFTIIPTGSSSQQSSSLPAPSPSSYGILEAFFYGRAFARTFQKRSVSVNGASAESRAPAVSPIYNNCVHQLCVCSWTLALSSSVNVWLTNILKFALSNSSAMEKMQNV